MIYGFLWATEHKEPSRVSLQYSPVSSVLQISSGSYKNYVRTLGEAEALKLTSTCLCICGTHLPMGTLWCLAFQQDNQPPIATKSWPAQFVCIFLCFCHQNRPADSHSLGQNSTEHLAKGFFPLGIFHTCTLYVSLAQFTVPSLQNASL